jgi:hypothetical protein
MIGLSREKAMNASAKLGVMGLCVGFSIVAQAQPAAEKPNFNVGDKWMFNQTMGDGKTTTWSREIVEIPAGEQLRVRMGSGKVEAYDGRMNFMPEGNPEYMRMLAKYPLKVGDEWTLSRKFSNPMSAENGKAKVVAFESLTVPAGTFQCYRVEAETTLNNKSYKETRAWVRWYCPDVKWIAKETLETRTTSRSTGSNATSETSELVKFTPGK